MADISQIKLDSVTYSIKDETARTTASTAKSTADTAKSTAESAQTAANKALESTYEITYSSEILSITKNA